MSKIQSYCISCYKVQDGLRFYCESCSTLPKGYGASVENVGETGKLCVRCGVKGAMGSSYCRSCTKEWMNSTVSFEVFILEKICLGCNLKAPSVENRKCLMSGRGCDPPKENKSCSIDTVTKTTRFTCGSCGASCVGSCLFCNPPLDVYTGVTKFDENSVNLFTVDAAKDDLKIGPATNGYVALPPKTGVLKEVSEPTKASCPRCNEVSETKMEGLFWCNGCNGAHKYLKPFTYNQLWRVTSNLGNEFLCGEDGYKQPANIMCYPATYLTTYKCDRCAGPTIIPGLCNGCISIVTDPKLNKLPVPHKPKAYICKKCGLSPCMHPRGQ